MASSLWNWALQYQQHKHQAVFIDVETCWPDGPIAVVGVYRRGQPYRSCQQFVRQRNLTKEDLTKAFQWGSAVVTYGGKTWDIEKIRKTYPDLLPKSMPTIDCAEFSEWFTGKKLGLQYWEKKLRLNKLGPRDKKVGDMTRLWKRHTQGDKTAFKLLLKHNKADTVNLYPLAERFEALGFMNISTDTPSQLTKKT